MTHEEFLQMIGGTAPRLSYSSIKNLLRSPRKFAEYYTKPKQPTEAMVLGSALHCAILRPQDFQKEYAVAPELDRRTKAGKEAFEAFTQAAEGRTVLTSAQYQDLQNKAAIIQNSELAQSILAPCTVREEQVEAVLTHANLGQWAFRLILDARDPDKKIIVDLKSCSDVQWFKWDAKKLHYDLQAALYKALYPTAEFYFIAVDAEDCGVFHASPDFLAAGQEKLTTCLQRLRELRTFGGWFGGMDVWSGLVEL